MTKKHLLLALVLVVILVIARNRGPISLSSSSQEGSLLGGIMLQETSRGLDDIGYYDQKASAPSMIVADPMPTSPSAVPSPGDDIRLIKTGNLELVVSRVAESMDTIASIVKSKDGFIMDASQYESPEGTHFGSVTIRVPVVAFEETLAAVKSIASIVRTENISGVDVTEAYADLEARLRNARAQEEQYLTILRQARSVEDMLAVQRELGNIRAQIESMDAQRQVMEDQTDYSTIYANLSEEPTVVLQRKPFRPGDAAREAVQAVIVLVQRGILGSIWLAIFAAAAAPVILIGLGIRSLLLRRRSSRS